MSGKHPEETIKEKRSVLKLLQDWGPIIITAITLYTIWHNGISANAARELTATQVGKDVAEIKVTLSSYQALQMKLNELAKVVETHEAKISKLDIDVATDKGITTQILSTLQAQNRMLEVMSTEINNRLNAIRQDLSAHMNKE